MVCNPQTNTLDDLRPYILFDESGNSINLINDIPFIFVSITFKNKQQLEQYEKSAEELHLINNKNRRRGGSLNIPPLDNVMKLIDPNGIYAKTHGELSIVACYVNTGDDRIKEMLKNPPIPHLDKYKNQKTTNWIWLRAATITYDWAIYNISPTFDMRLWSNIKEMNIIFHQKSLSIPLDGLIQQAFSKDVFTMNMNTLFKRFDANVGGKGYSFPNLQSYQLRTESTENVRCLAMCDWLAHALYVGLSCENDTWLTKYIKMGKYFIVDITEKVR